MFCLIISRANRDILTCSSYKIFKALRLSLVSCIEGGQVPIGDVVCSDFARNRRSWSKWTFNRFHQCRQISL